VDERARLGCDPEAKVVQVKGKKEPLHLHAIAVA
jgi:hypothetical protein